MKMITKKIKDITLGELESLNLWHCQRYPCLKCPLAQNGPISLCKTDSDLESFFSEVEETKVTFPAEAWLNEN